jgi:hypothetical protein
MTFLPDSSILQLTIRMAVTAFVVIAVAMAVVRLGPLIGGALAGLPIILGPGFYFLMLQASGAFVADAATYGLLAMCATQVFLLIYIAVCGRSGSLVSLAAGVSGWVGAVAMFRLLPPHPALAAGLFAVVTLIARLAARRFVKPVPPVGRADRFGVLLLRGVLAGLLVAVVTMAAVWLGPDGSGLLLGFPVGYSIIATTVHDRYGAAMAAATLHSGLLGTVSLAGFCAALAFTVTVLPAPWPFLLGLAVSLLFTTTLVLMSRKRGNRA